MSFMIWAISWTYMTWTHMNQMIWLGRYHIHNGPSHSTYHMGHIIWYAHMIWTIWYGPRHGTHHKDHIVWTDMIWAYMIWIISYYDDIPFSMMRTNLIDQSWYWVRMIRILNTLLWLSIIIILYDFGHLLWSVWYVPYGMVNMIP